MTHAKVLAFDIGIKNLAFCILEGDQVRALENCNILQSVEPVFCEKCKLRAAYTVEDKQYCKRHIPKTHTVLAELNEKKLPVNKVLKELVATHKCEVTGNKHTNRDYLTALSTKFAMRFEQPKQENASKVSLEIIHDALRKFVQEKRSLFVGTTAVLLENQPVFKNPHMKSVQVLLFATLRSLFLDNGETPSYHFVHAKKKVTVVQKGDAGYAERKQKSEERLETLFNTNVVHGSVLYENWKKSVKKSDMADALCMTVDYMLLQ